MTGNAERTSSGRESAGQVSAGQDAAEQDGAGRADARLAHQAIAAGDPTGWFEPLYAAASAGKTSIPWDRNAPSPLLVRWAAERDIRDRIRGVGQRRALVVGCGLGNDAEFAASLGFATTAFDISPSAIEAARRRFPESPVEYQVADLLAPPPTWSHGFDLVIESMTLQALPEPTRAIAAPCLSPLVASGGTLVVFARGRPPGSPDDGPPFALTRPEIDSIASGGLERVEIARIEDGTTGAAWRWRAEFRRPGGPGRTRRTRRTRRTGRRQGHEPETSAPGPAR